MRKYLLFASAAVSILSSCSNSITLEPVSFDELDGWKRDNLREVLPALLQSAGKENSDFQNFYTGLSRIKNGSSQELRSYIETHLTPYRVVSNNSATGQMTAYYIPQIRGSKTRTKQTQIPIYGVPKGYKAGDKLASRQKIAEEVGYAPIIAWADDAVDLFLLQIEGSGRLRTPTGEILYLGYAGNNGYSFKSIGKIMKEAGILTQEKVSMQEMRRWLKDHPEDAKKLMNQNPRYIFFKLEKSPTAYGSTGVVLTPERSVAVDTAHISIHTPMWITTQDESGVSIHKTVVAQDTGDAIKGPNRIDLFCGHSEKAVEKGTSMNQKGQSFLLLPKTKER